MNARTDIHSPKNLVTEEYSFVQCFDNNPPQPPLTPSIGWWENVMVPWQENYARLSALVATSPLSDRGLHQCHHCGAHFRYLAVMLHTPSGQHIAIGETCLDNRFERATVEFQAARKAAELDRQAHRIQAEALECLATIEDADTAEALVKNADLARFNLSDWALGVVTDIRRKLYTYGSISPKQIAFVARLLAEAPAKAAERAAIAEEVNVPAPTGRVTFEGVVVSLKAKDTDYGLVWKMTVKVQDDVQGGVWLAWVTQPNALAGVERGDTVRMTATLTQSDNAHFAFGKRPSKAVNLGKLTVEATEDALAE